MFYEVELVKERKIYIKNFELLTQSVTSFCVTRFRNSRIPNLSSTLPSKTFLILVMSNIYLFHKSPSINLHYDFVAK